MLAPFGIRPKGTLLARMLPLAQALNRRGHCVVIVAPPVSNPEDAGTRVDHAGVVVIHTPLPMLSGPAGVAMQVISLVRAALHEQPAILHVFKPKGYSGLAARAIHMGYPQLPLVVDTDDWEGWGGWNDLLPYPYAAKLLFAWQERDLPRCAAAVTVASRTLETQVWGFGVPPGRVVLVANGAESGERRIQNSKFEIQNSELRTQNSELKTQPLTLLLYTRFWEFDMRALVVALVAIAGRGPQVRVLVVGRGERGEERELLRLAARAGIGALIDYRGWVEPQAIPALLTSVDVALVPLADTLINRARGLAKLLELMQAGLPIVAHAVGQAGEYLEHGVSGLLVPPGDTAAFVRAALALLDDPTLRQRLGAGAQMRATARYSWDRIAEDAQRAYQMALF